MTSRKASLAAAGGILGFGCLLLILWLSPFDSARVSEFGAEFAGNRQFGTRLSETGAMIDRLQRTNLLNGAEIHDQLGLADSPPSRRRYGFRTHSPFEPRYGQSYLSRPTPRYPLPANAHSYELNEADSTFSFHGQEAVLNWYSEPANAEVCAVGFVDSSRVDYRLRTFPDPQSALSEGYVITHRGHCGTCSSLRDLAAYLAQPDMTTAARTCARRLTATGIKACLIDEVGLDECCAETWTYNVLHTMRHCAATCIEHYGFWNVLANTIGQSHTDERGNLNPCLACDEHTSGPGFQYAAGRTRRTSGLQSAIRRPAEQIDQVDHSLYFR